MLTPGEEHSCMAWWAGSSKTANASAHSSPLSTVPGSMKRKLERKEAGKIGVVVKILHLIKRNLFSTCAKELRKAEGILKCQVKAQCGTPSPCQASEMYYPKGETMGQGGKLLQLRRNEMGQHTA